MLKQALRILCDNAVKYTPEGMPITIAAEKDGKGARISVQDNGMGVPAEELSRIFDRFYRSDSARSRQAGGAGLAGRRIAGASRRR